MRGLKVALIISLMLAFMIPVSALSMPYQFGSLMSFPELSMNINPLGTSSLWTSDSSPTMFKAPSMDLSSIAFPSLSELNGFQIMPSTTTVSSPITSMKKGGFGQDAPEQNPIPLQDITVPQDKKNKALEIAANSPLCKEYNVYPDDSWQARWETDPSDGHTIRVSTGLPNYYSVEIVVDLNTGNVVKSDYVPPI
ncbi:MAG TPA: hypothetical protein VMC84_01515 [Methanocella sp.]|uniref:hypothetical protein n=1 Tax=Methanocella sp. TaxID=2052833 RepID=UPI002C78A85F|nr:hypothetical protein [Methanocella sp.]HTY89831.1 hypothetical protein [Methanocella sp.]